MDAPAQGDMPEFFAGGRIQGEEVTIGTAGKYQTTCGGGDTCRRARLNREFPLDFRRDWVDGADRTVESIHGLFVTTAATGETLANFIFFITLEEFLFAIEGGDVEKSGLLTVGW